MEDKRKTIKKFLFPLSCFSIWQLDCQVEGDDITIYQISPNGKKLKIVTLDFENAIKLLRIMLDMADEKLQELEEEEKKEEILTEEISEIQEEKIFEEENEEEKRDKIEGYIYRINEATFGNKLKIEEKEGKIILKHKEGEIIIPDLDSVGRVLDVLECILYEKHNYYYYKFL